MSEHAAKVGTGADDFLRERDDAEGDLDRLPRIDMSKSLDIEATTQGDAVVLRVAQHSLSLAFDAIHEHSDGIHAELVVSTDLVGEIHWGKLNLSSTQAGETLCKKLLHIVPSAPWRVLIEKACRAVAKAVRIGEPIVRLQPRKSTDEEYVVPKLVLRNETNLIYGDGASTKSLTAAAIAVAVDLGATLPCGLTPTERCAVLVLDWESTRKEWEGRMFDLMAGLGVDGVPRIHYRRMTRGLAEDAAFIRAEIDRLKIGLVIVDSYGPACGTEPESADSAIRLMNTLRSFANTTRLVICHVSKASVGQRAGPSKPFGSVYVSNLARSSWELRRPDDDSQGEATVGFYHSKVNARGKFPPFGLRFTFEDGRTLVRSADMASEPELMRRTTLQYQIAACLRAGSKGTAEIAEEIESPKATVKRTLTRMRGKGKVISLADAKWGLPDSRTPA